MRRAVVLASLLALASGVAIAQNADVIKARKETFKAMGGAAGPMGKMLRGEEAFDLAKVQAGLKTIAENNQKVAKLFPADSKDGDTKALPAIWTDKAKFDAIFAKLDAAVAAAIPAIKDEASFKAEAPKVLGNCGACHNDFRQKNN